MEFTGERYVPSESGDIQLEHLHRYLIARELVAGRRVLDIGCGEGYGADLLAAAAARVIGMDVDEAAIEHAQHSYQRPNLTFQVGDCLAIPLEAGSVDVVVCFETIEHLDDHEGAMAEFKRVLAPHGLLILSTPDKHEYSDATEYENPFHVRELYVSDVSALLKGHFRHHELHGQRVHYGSAIGPMGDTKARFIGFDMQAGDLAPSRGVPRPLYTLATASDGPLPGLPAGLLASSAIPSADAESRLEIERSQHEAIVRKLTADHLASSAQLASDFAIVERERSALESTVAKLDADLLASRMELSRSQSDLWRLNAELAVANASVSSRIKDSARRHGRRLARVYARAVLHFVPRSRVTTFWRNPLFDKVWYLSEYADVRADGSDPERHFRVHGAEEGRNPNSMFDTSWYLESYYDVGVARLNALDHYWLYGTAEARNPSNRFDTGWYLSNNPDVRASGMNPLHHYLLHGISESRPPLPSAPPAASADWLTSLDTWIASDLRLMALARRLPAAGQVAALTDGRASLGMWSESVAEVRLESHSARNGAAPLSDIALVELSRARGTSHMILADALVRGLPQRHALAAYLANRYREVSREPGRDVIFDVTSPRVPLTEGRVSVAVSASVSVIVPTFNSPELVAACLRSLDETVPSETDCEVVVVDDGSPGDARRQLRDLAAGSSRVSILARTSNEGFIASCNDGAGVASGEVLVFLNDDTILLPGWLEPLVAALATYPSAGVVGGRLLHPDGSLQEAGGLIFAGADGYKFGYGESEPDAPLFSFARPVDYVSGALLATRRSLYQGLGGFSTDYGFGYFEDADYCFRAQANGLKVYYEPRSTIIHLEGGTAGRDLTKGAKRSQDANRSVFQARWEERLGRHRQRPTRLDRSALWDLALNGSGQGTP